MQEMNMPPEVRCADSRRTFFLYKYHFVCKMSFLYDNRGP